MTSTNHNAQNVCSAIQLTLDGRVGGWYFILCDQILYSSFFCDTRMQNSSKSFVKVYKERYSTTWYYTNYDSEAGGISTIKVHANQYLLVCKKGWILVNNKCFQIKKLPHRLLQIYESSCSDDNATLPVLPAYWHLGKLSSYELDDVAIVYVRKPYSDILKLAELVRYLNILRDFEINFGFPYFTVRKRKQDEIIQLLDLFATMTAKHLNISVVTEAPQKCLYIFFSMNYVKFKTNLGETIDRWSMNETSCSNIASRITVCQSTPRRYSVDNCPERFLKCQSYGCVLNLYICDTYLDCPGGEDELNCDYKNEDIFWKPCVYSNTSDIPLPVHAFCDGISQCHKKQDELQCFNRRKYVHLESAVSYELTDENVGLRLKCFNKHDTFDINNSCILKKHQASIGCKDGKHLLGCQSIGCSGMFKCSGGFCIDIVLVCDSNFDCPSGEDEALCDDIQCPGMIRCRGESQCVPPWQVCDGIVHCAHSLDDEAACQTCITGCTCSYYTAHCIYNAITTNNHMFVFWKVLVIRGNVGRFNMTVSLEMNRLVFLNMASLGLEEMYLTVVSTSLRGLLFLDLSNNMLTNLKYLGSTFFSNLRDLDCSWNYLQNLIYNIEFLYLQFVDFSFNYIKYLTKQLTKGMPSLVQMNIIGNPILRIYANALLDNHMLDVLYTDQYQTCCLLQTNTFCSLKSQHCYGILAYFQYRICALFECSVGILLAAAVLLFGIWDIYLRKKSSNISTITSSIILATLLIKTCIVTSTILYININSLHPSLVWRNSNSCYTVTLGGFIFILVSVLTHVFYCFFINLKTIYPFKHQCRFLTYSPLFCAFIWCFAVTATILIHLFISETKTYLNGDLCFLHIFNKTIKLVAGLFHILATLVNLGFCISFIKYIKSTLMLPENKLKAMMNYVTYCFIQILLWVFLAVINFLSRLFIDPIHQDIVTTIISYHSFVVILLRFRQAAKGRIQTFKKGRIRLKK